MKDTVIKRLQSLGVTYLESDNWLIDYSIEKVEKSVKGFCNVSKIPDGLSHYIIDRVCGEFLFFKRQSGQLDTVFPVEQAAKSVKIGDVNVTYEDTASTEERISILISQMMSAGEEEMVRYRRLRW